MTVPSRSRFRPLLHLFVSALTAAVLVPGVASAATEGTIHGSVHADATGEDVPGIEVAFLDDETGREAATFTTDADGRYEGAVPAGDYLVRLSDPMGRYATELLGGGDVLTATVVSVAAGATVSVEDGALDGLTGTLLGRVEDAGGSSGSSGDGGGVAGIDVQVFEARFGDLVTVASTDPTGDFSVDLPVGSYVVRYEDPTHSYLPSFSDGQPTASSSLVHDVAADQITFVGPDLLTRSSGRVLADVRDNTSGDALVGIDILLYDGSGELVATAVSGESAVEFADLPAGAYLARFVDPTGTYAAAFSGGVATAMDAQTVTLAPDGTAFLEASLEPSSTPPTGTSPGTLNVHVTRDAVTAPVSGAAVTVFAAGTLTPAGSGTTAADGTTEFVLPAGSYIVRVDDPTGTVGPSFSGDAATISDSSPVLVPDGGAVIDEHHLTEPVLAPGTVAGLVKHVVTAPSPLVPGGPAADVEVVVVDVDAMTEVATLRTDEDGTFSAAVAAGHYLVYSWIEDPLEDGRRRFDVGHATVEPGGTGSVTLELGCCDGFNSDPTTTVTRTLPGSSIDVAVFDLQTGSVRGRQTSSDAKVTFSLPLYGRYVIWAVDPLGRYHCSWDDDIDDESCHATLPVIEYPAFGPLSRPIAMQPTLPPPPEDGLLSGTVLTGGSGTTATEPVAGAQVTVFDDSTGDLVDVTSTQSDGRYTAEVPIGGSYLVRFSDPGGTWRGFYAAAELAADASPVAVPTDADVTGIDFFVETHTPPGPGPATVDVELTFQDTSAPAQGVEVDLIDVTSLVVLATATVDGDGHARLEVNAPVDVVARYRDPFGRAPTQFFSGSDSLGSALVQHLTAGTFAINDSIVRGVARVEGTVDARTTDDFDFPLGGVEVEAIDATTLTPVATTTSDADGTFALDVPAPGHYLFRYRAEGFATVLAGMHGGPVDLSIPGDAVEPGSSHRAEGNLTSIDGRLHGEVLDEHSGTGISGVGVEIWDPRTFTHVTTSTSAADGVFSADLPAGEYLVRIVDPLGRFAPVWYDAMEAPVTSSGVVPVVVEAATRTDLRIERRVNVPPAIAVTGVTDGDTYEHGAVPAAGCSWSDAEDGSGTVTATLSTLAGPRAADGLGTQTATCSYTDTGGATVVATATYTIVDTVAPTLTLPALSPVEATGPDGATVEFAATATDGVDGALTPDCLPASGSTFAIGTTTIECTATDLEGNEATDTFTVVVQDRTGPTLTLPAGQVVSATSADGAVVEYTAAAEDLVSGSVEVTCAPASGSTFPLGATTVECSATDAAANTTDGSFTVTVQDDNAPVVTVPEPITREAEGPGGAAVDYEVSATDDVDGTLAATCEPGSGSTFPLGDTTVGCTATDDAGNTGSNSFTVSVVDTTPPAISVPASVEAEATSALGATVTFTVSAHDVVDGTITPDCGWQSGETFPVGTAVVTCTATDEAGNDAVESFPVIVSDTTPPVVTVPADLTVEASSAEGATVTYSGQSASDLVDGAVVPVSCDPASGSTMALGATAVTCSATDAAGNTGTASFDVTVVDTTAPLLALPANVVVPASGPDGATFAYSATANDLVSGSMDASCDPSAGSTFPLGVTIVECTATDQAGNTATGTFTVTVQDQSAPQVEDLTNHTLEATGPDGAALDWGEVTAEDDVDGSITATCTPAAGSVFAIGTTTVTCAATDGAGNVGENTFDVTVQDTTAPVVTTPDAIEVAAASADGEMVTYGDVSAADLVDGTLEATCSHPSGALFPLGVTTVTCTATDAAGNIGSRSFTVTVGVEWGGVSPPVASDGTSVFRLKQTIPVKFSLAGVSADIGDLTAKLYVSKVTDDVAGDEEEATSTSRADTGNQFRYDGDGQYVFNLGTRALSPGTWQLRIDLGDGVVRTVRFGLRG